MTLTIDRPTTASPFCDEHPAGTADPCGACARARRALTPATVVPESSTIRKLREQLREEKRKRHAAENALRKVLHHYAVTPTAAAKLMREQR